MSDPLSAYRDKRDFDATPEPPAGAHAATDGTPLFVLQQHSASSDHFDLRIEHSGVLASWAVPKGPSTDPGEQRLAVRTEDHPVAYGDFEGRIPEDEYGGGEVIVWDMGPFHNLTTDDDGEPVEVADAIGSGSLHVWLQGEKLTGGYRLVHAKVGGDDDKWLLSKTDDDGADARRNPVSTEPASVLSGRTIEDLEQAEGLPSWDAS